MSAVVLITGVVALSIAWLVGAGLSVLGRLALALTRTTGLPSSALRAGLALVPSIVAFLALLAILVPNPMLACHCASHGAHHLHLCLRHPLLAGPLLLPAVVLAGAWGAVAMARVFRIVREVIAGELWLRQLRRLPPNRVDDAAFRLVGELGFSAFAVGIFKPLVVVDRLLWERLGSDERRAVIHHEQAHALRRDALTFAMLRIANALTPWPFSDRWLRAWRTASERACDQHAAITIGEPASVAQALVSVERLRSTIRPAPPCAPALGIAAGAELEERVRALLAEEELARTPTLASDLRWVGGALFGLTLLVLAWPGGSLHHVVETLLGELVHRLRY